MSIVTGIIERKIGSTLLTFSEEAKMREEKSSCFKSSGPPPNPIQPSSFSSFQEMDGAVEADGIEISLVQLSKQERHNSRSRWFPSGPLRREGERGDIFHPPPPRSHCSPDILLTFGLKFNGTHIPHPPLLPALLRGSKGMIEMDGDKKEEVRVARLL